MLGCLMCRYDSFMGCNRCRRLAAEAAAGTADTGDAVPSSQAEAAEADSQGFSGQLDNQAREFDSQVLLSPPSEPLAFSDCCKNKRGREGGRVDGRPRVTTPPNP